MNNSLSEFIFQSKYARYDQALGRKETWEESVTRIHNMHIDYLNDKYQYVFNNAEFRKDFLESIKAYKDKLFIGSQRALQFGGTPILNKHARLFNCSFTYVDRLEVFKEIEWVLLCGCGAGISVEHQHINKLPKMLPQVSKDTETYVIEDSIEGWALAIQQIINYYFIPNTKYPKFDYSNIRPKGAFISGGFIAPGPNGLKNSINKIQEILESVHKTTKQLSSLNCTDIISHCADSVLSGGVRRSALIVIFDEDDEEMFTCKTGNWFYDNPQRARFNMSAALDRKTTSKETFERIINATKEFGEPGFYWRSDNGVGPNPCCLPAWATVITPTGLKTLNDVGPGDMIWSKEGWTKIVNKISQGDKEVLKYRTSGGTFYGTSNHKIIENGVKVEVGQCTGIDSLSGPEINNFTVDIQSIVDGLVIGDRSVHKASNNLVYLHIGENDQDYFQSELKEYIIKHRPELNKSNTAYEVRTTITSEEMDYKYAIDIPNRFIFGEIPKVLGFLRGLYSANGSVVSNRITYKTTSPKLRDSLQLMLSRIGIDSYYTTNKPHKVKFDNEEYECKESYDINITSDREKFVKLIGFIQKYKNDKITILPTKNLSNYRKLLSVENISVEEVFDIEVDNSSHTFWCNGLNISNCEIGFKPVINGKTGFQFCNLVTINGANIESEEDFYKACRCAATLATVQAAYNEFPFLGKTTEELVKSDPLIGVSIGGIMCNPEILTNPEILKKGASIVKKQNVKIADILKINHSSRCTTIKPDGNSSVLLNMTPGCHGEHAKYYIRRVQVNKDEEAGQIYKKYNPKAVTDSVWSVNHTDWCISFPKIAKPNAVMKSELVGLAQLEVVKVLYNNWILEGMVDRNSPITNNVSNTVQVQDWKEVTDWVWENRNYVAGISFLPLSGDLDFNQPPYTEVLMPDKLLEIYGDGIMFASGLIVDAINVFGDLWKACDALYGRGEKLFTTYEDAVEFISDYNIAKQELFLDKPYSEYIKASNEQYTRWINLYIDMGYSEDFAEQLADNDFPIPVNEVQKYLDSKMFGKVPKLSEKREIIRRLRKFACKYFDCDLELAVKALKHVQLLHDWYDITSSYVPIDWKEVKWKKVLINADETGAMACSGGNCEIKRL